jgi:hypothetical protein
MFWSKYLLESPDRDETLAGFRASLHSLNRLFLREVKKRKARDSPFTDPELEEWHRRYWKVLRQGRREYPLDRLERLRNFDLPFTSNEAERAFRFLKPRMKISGCFRTIAGARRHIRIYRYISTLRKNGPDVLEYLRRASP